MKDKKKPVNPKLPGRYGRMTAEELESEVAQYDGSFDESKFKPLTAAEKRLDARVRMGRPRIGRGAEKIRVSMERGLLAQVDAFARKNGLSRSQLIARGVRAVMAP